MCTISVIGLDIIGTFKGKEAIPYLYVYICEIYICIMYIYNVFTSLEYQIKKHPFHISEAGKYRCNNYF